MAETEKQKDIYILGIESSCDETAASVVKNGREVLSNVISSDYITYPVRWCGAGNRIPQTYREDQSGH